MSTHQSKRLKNTTIGTFFKSDREVPKTADVDSFNELILERGPKKRLQIWQYCVNQQDEIRQYSPTTDVAYCLPCYLFACKPNGRFEANAYTVAGFCNWKNVNDTTCALLTHVGNHSSTHSAAVKSCEDLMTQSRHIDNFMMNQSAEQILKNRLRLKISIDCVRWLAYQSCPFRRHDEGPKSTNPGNFIEMVKLLASYNEKEILHIIATKVRTKIREDIARDESKKEQMALVLRFVDKGGVLQEHFFDIDCPYAYYVHCFAHRLQLALVTTSMEVILVHQFFTKVDSIVNILINAHAEISRLKSISEVETGKGANQIGTLQRTGNTRWGSHFSSICSLIKMFNATCIVVQSFIVDGANFSQRGDADSAYTTMASFQFVFILILMKEVMGITNVLCQTLQQKSQDILNAMNLVSTTKQLLQKLRDNGWDAFLSDVISFCENKNIEMPDMNGAYKVGRGKFCDQTVKLVTLSLALDPSNSYKSFNADHICTLIEKYYPQDFTERERLILKFQSKHYYLDVIKHPNLYQISTLAAFCEGLAETKKFEIYYLVDILIRLIVLLPIFTATTERAFSVMKLTKTKLRNKMEDEFLGDCMLLHIERDIADTFSTNSIIEDFYTMKDRRVHFN
ncbi:hypothetical protein ABFS83_06G143300 [Erythranthe nasuta]